MEKTIAKIVDEDLAEEMRHRIIDIVTNKIGYATGEYGIETLRQSRIIEHIPNIRNVRLTRPGISSMACELAI